MTANIFFGSNEEKREKLQSIINPYSKEVVSKYPMCTKEDTLQALEIAKKASIQTKKSTLAQRVAWLEDVITKLKENKEDIAKTLCDEVDKPIIFASDEVERCIGTVSLSIHGMRDFDGHT